MSQLIRSRKISQFSSKNFARAPRLTRSEKFHRSLRDLFDPDFFFFFYYALPSSTRKNSQRIFPSFDSLSLSLFFLETSLDTSTNEKKKFPHLPETQVWMAARMMIYCLFREGNKERLERKIQKKFCPHNISLENDPKLLSDPKMTRLALEKSSAGTGKGGVRTFSESVDSWRCSSTFWLGAKS